MKVKLSVDHVLGLQHAFHFFTVVWSKKVERKLVLREGLAVPLKPFPSTDRGQAGQSRLDRSAIGAFGTNAGWRQRSGGCSGWPPARWCYPKAPERGL